MSACFSVCVFFNSNYFHVCRFCLSQSLSFSILVFSSEFSSVFPFLTLCLFVCLSVSLFLLSILLLVGIFLCLSVCVLSGHVVTKKQLFSSKFFFKIFLQDKCQKFSPSLKNNRGVKQIIAHRLHFKCFPLCHSSECKLSHISAHCEKIYN